MTDIKYPKRMAQLHDFKNMHLYKGFTPTDIDFAFDYRGQVFIWGELKLLGMDVPEGQMRHLNALLHNAILADKEALLVVANHVGHPSQPIDVGNCNVAAMWWTDGGELHSKDEVNQRVNVVCERFLKAKGVPNVSDYESQAPAPLDW